jgi:hypothetical protein
LVDVPVLGLGSLSKGGKGPISANSQLTPSSVTPTAHRLYLPPFIGFINQRRVRRARTTGSRNSYTQLDVLHTSLLVTIIDIEDYYRIGRGPSRVHSPLYACNYTRCTRLPLASPRLHYTIIPSNPSLYSNKIYPRSLIHLMLVLVIPFFNGVHQVGPWLRVNGHLRKRSCGR